MRGSWPRVATASALLALASCVSTTDSIGYDGIGGVRLKPLPRKMTYPNPFRDDLGKTDAEVSAKIEATFRQLFYGEPLLQSIYVQIPPDQANIQDTLHGDVRTEGIGLAMMIALQLDKRSEFDRLWTFAERQKKQTTGPRRGYFESSCDTRTGTMTCDDPFGAQQMVTALIFAHDRWTSTSGPINYEAAAVDLLTVMRHKEDENGGVVDGITDTFDTETALPFHLPVEMSAGVGRPSIVMPAYYDLWAVATGDAFWTRAAAAARSYWKRTAHEPTGLFPVRARFDGTPVPDWDTFESEAYRTQVNMALDWAWARGEPDGWLVEEADTLLYFFTAKGIDRYVGKYTLDGDPIDLARDYALIAANGITAMVAASEERVAYLNAVWAMDTPTGPARYYSGILDLTALLVLSGQYRIW